MLCNFIEITLLHGWSPVNLQRFCRTSFLKNTNGGLLLDIYTITRNTFILSMFSFQFINLKWYLWKQKSEFKLVSLTVSHTKVPKQYFYKCTHSLLSLSLSTVIIHQFYSYTKILTLISLIFAPNSSRSRPYSPHSPHSVPRFPVPAFTDSQRRLLPVFIKRWNMPLKTVPVKL